MKLIQTTVSGVSRIPCALGKKCSCVPSSTKTEEFEIKNRRKSPKEAKAKLSYSYFFFFENKTHLALEMNWTKL